MRNWEQVLTVPPATSDWTVTQIFSKQNWKKNITKKKIRQITRRKKTEKNRNKTANISNFKILKSASNTTATISIKADFFWTLLNILLEHPLLKKNTVLEKKIKATYCQILTLFCRWDLDLDESVNNSSNKSWYQVSKKKKNLYL